MKNLLTSFIAASLLVAGCKAKTKADLLVYNATIYTVDSLFSTQEAMVIAQGKVVATGGLQELQRTYDYSDSFDAKGGFIYPGFNDAHAHFVGYAASLRTASLVATESWQQVLTLLQAFAQQHPEGWIIGRGWDQNDWKEKSFPDNRLLNAMFPDRPVLLTRIDGHAAIANQRALERAGITAGQHIDGGAILTKDGVLTGILVDNAVDLVSRVIPAATDEEFQRSILTAQENCWAVGLTSLTDCGLDYPVVEQLRDLQQKKQLKLRLNIMLSDNPANVAYAQKKGKIDEDRLQVQSFKVYGDGALGSRGACLLKPYHDDKNNHGFLLSSPAHFDSVARWCKENGWQMNTHAIGDSGNRTILQIYSRYLTPGNDLRWRIEHAQVVDTADLGLFGRLSVIPSVQPTHATSDMYWASDRLGETRIKTAYAYRQLLEQNRWIPLGTDFPVEDISPFKTFCSAVFRQDAKGWPAGGFQTENALSREQTLRGMTTWAAKGSFEEKKKGSLEKDKWADFVLLDRDLIKASATQVLQTRVMATFIQGEKVFSVDEPKNKRP